MARNQNLRLRVNTLRGWMTVPGQRPGTWLLASAAGFMILFNLSATDFWGSIAESRRAEISREMLTDGTNPLVPTLNGRPILTKPPLFYWIQATSYRLAGTVDSGSARLPSAIAGIIILAITFQIGKQIGAHTTGLLAAGMTATTALFCDYARSAEIDMVFAGFMTISTAFLFRSITNEKTTGWTNGNTMGFWLFCGLAFMVKGPFALLFPLGGLAMTALCRRDWRLFSRLFYLPGPALFLLITVPYYAYLFLHVNNASVVIAGETVGRFSDTAVHGEPVYYYVPKLMVFMPWLPFLPPAIRLAWREKRPAGIFILSVAAASIAIASLIPSKKTVYLLPLCPWVALLYADWLRRLANRQHFRQCGACLYFRGLGILATAANVAMVGFAVSHGTSSAAAAGMAALLLISSIVLVRIFRSSSPIDAATYSIVLLLVALSVTHHQIMPILNDRHSVRKFAEAVARTIPAHETIVLFNTENYAIPFYSQRFVSHCTDSKKLPTGAAVIARRRDLDELQTQHTNAQLLLANTDLLGTVPVKGKYDLVLVRLNQQIQLN